MIPRHRRFAPTPMEVNEQRRDMKKEGVICQWGICGNPPKDTVDGMALCSEHADRYRERGRITSLEDVLEDALPSGDSYVD